jgi:hypothetical protein
MEAKNPLSTLGKVLGTLALLGALFIGASRYGGPLLAGVLEFAKPSVQSIQPAQAAPLAPRVSAPQTVRSFAVPQRPVPAAAPQTAPVVEAAPAPAAEQPAAPQVQREILSIQQQPADGSTPPVEVRRVIITTTGAPGDETIVSDRGSKRKSGRP